MLKQRLRDTIAKFLARCMTHFALDPRYFELWQANGFHVKQTGFYSPIPNTADLPAELFESDSELVGVDLNEEGQVSLLHEVADEFRSEFEELQNLNSNQANQFHFHNTSFESVDAEMLYCMIRKFKPQRFIEIGSGYSTLIASRAMAKNLESGTKGVLTAIEPYPPAFLKETLEFPLNLRVEKVQATSLDLFTSMSAGDILFIDSSHVCKAGSDTQFEFLEILPRLPSGVVVHVHDIFFPREYPRSWVMQFHRFWNEQYLLQAFLNGNKDISVLWSGSWMHRFHSNKLQDSFSSYDPESTLPASFWMVKN